MTKTELVKALKAQAGPATPAPAPAAYDGLFSLIQAALT
jgi:hypothetical protein